MTKKRSKDAKKSKKAETQYVTLRIDEHTEILVERLPSAAEKVAAEAVKSEAVKSEELIPGGEEQLCGVFSERAECGAAEAFRVVRGLLGKALDELKALDSDELQVEAGVKIGGKVPLLTQAEANIKVTLKWKKSA